MSAGPTRSEFSPPTSIVRPRYHGLPTAGALGPGLGGLMELRLGNQQRHSITAILLSAVVIIFGLVLADTLTTPDPDPSIGPIDAVDSTSPSGGPSSESDNDDQTADIARSNARFTLNPDVTVVTTTAPPSTTARATAQRATTATTTTTVATTAPTVSTTVSTTTSETTETTPPPDTSGTTTTKKPPRTTSTTIHDGETTTTKKCRGNRPGCRKP